MTAAHREREMPGGIRRWAAVAFVCALVAGSGAARAADDYPNHPVRWIGRLSSGRLDRHLRPPDRAVSVAKTGQQFAHREQAGCGQQPRRRTRGHAPPDGYTVFLVNPANTINASLYKNLPFNFISDMAPVGGFIRVPNVMEVNPSGAGENGRRIHRLRQGQSGQDQYGVRPASAPRCICPARCS